MIIHDHMLTPGTTKNLQMKQFGEPVYFKNFAFKKKMRFVEKNKVILIVKRNNRKRNFLKRNPKHLLYVVI